MFLFAGLHVIKCKDLHPKHIEKRPECKFLTRINVIHRYIEHGGSGPELEAWKGGYFLQCSCPKLLNESGVRLCDILCISGQIKHSNLKRNMHGSDCFSRGIRCD